MNDGALTPGAAIVFAWVAWAISWLAASVAWRRKTVKHADYGRVFPSRIMVFIGALVLFVSLVSATSSDPSALATT